MCEGYIDMQECAEPRSAPPSLAPSLLSPAPAVTGPDKEEEACTDACVDVRARVTHPPEEDKEEAAFTPANIREEQMPGKV